MKAIVLLCFLAFAPAVLAQPPYGFLGSSDEKVIQKLAQPDYEAVILGCVYELDPSPDPPKLLHILHVTVIESYKGPLAVGQKITVIIAAESAPPDDKVLGNLRFFFLQQSKSSYAPKGAYACEGVDTAPFSADYGPALRKLLLSQSAAKSQ